MAMLTGALSAYGFSAFFTPLIREFGWTRAGLSGVVSLSRLEGGIIAPVVGYLIDSFGPRRLMLLGITILGVGFLLFSQVNSLIMLYVVYIFVISIGSSLGTVSPVQVAVANWFVRMRSRALGILISGVGLGGTLTPGVVWLISQYGWRGTAVIFAFLMWGIGLPLALVVRHRPEPYGYLPDGDTPVGASSGLGSTGSAHGDPSPDHSVGVLSSVPAEVDFTAKEALFTRAFWALALTYGLWTMVTGITTVHQLPFLEDVGIPREVAAGVLGTFTLISVLGRVGFGWLGDYVDKRYLLAGCLALQTVGLLFLANVRTLWDVIPFLILFSPGYGGTIPLRAAIQGEYYGRKAFGTISGLLRFVDLWGTVAGPVFAGWMYDVRGGYRLAFVIIAGLNLLAAVTVLAATRPKKKPHLTTQEAL